MQVDQLAVVRAQVGAHLQSLGWKMLESVAVARKTFETAVGPKDAHAYLGHLRKDGASFLLTGDYWSEGRNVLESAVTLVPREATGAQLEASVGRFASSVETLVGQSYAVTLLQKSSNMSAAAESAASASGL